MPDIDKYRELYDTLQNYIRNLGKENSQRKNSLEVNTRHLEKFARIESLFLEYKAEIGENLEELEEVQNLEELEEVKNLEKEIENFILEIRKILNTRLENINQNSFSSTQDDNISNMTEKFDLKLASSMLPSLDGTEETTKQLIDAIELYDSMLDNEGKKALTNYVLKIKLSQSAKIRLSKTYVSNTALVSALKEHLIQKKSISSLSIEFHQCRQENNSIDAFGKKLENLMTNLTLEQANGSDEAMQIFAKTNEKIAINTFANGLKDANIKTIIKARNYDRLSDAISGAKDEEITKNSTLQTVFFSKQTSKSSNNSKTFFNNSYRNNTFRGNYQNRGFQRGRFQNRSSYHNVGQYNNRGHNYRGQLNNNNIGQTNDRGINQNRGHFRGRQLTSGNYHRNNTHRNFFINSENTDGNSVSNENAPREENKFFRVFTE